MLHTLEKLTSYQYLKMYKKYPYPNNVGIKGNVSLKMGQAYQR